MVNESDLGLRSFEKLNDFIFEFIWVLIPEQQRIRQNEFNNLGYRALAIDFNLHQQ